MGISRRLKELVELKERHGAWLMVDEAHATGLYGQHRRGLAEARKVSERIEIQMGTLGKAAGSSGGYICGSKVLIEFLINQARSFIFSTAPTAAAVGEAKMGIECIRGKLGEERCERLWRNVDELLSELKDAAEGVGFKSTRGSKRNPAAYGWRRK